jgi:hypothetical protein
MTWSWPKVLIRARSVLKRPAPPTLIAPTQLAPVSAVHPTVDQPLLPARGASRLVERVGLFTLSMEDYAELVVALCAYAYPTPELMMRYGISSEEELAKVHELWQTRLATDPALRRRWLQLRDDVARRWSQPAA